MAKDSGLKNKAPLDIEEELRIKESITTKDGSSIIQSSMANFKSTMSEKEILKMSSDEDTKMRWLLVNDFNIGFAELEALSIEGYEPKKMSKSMVCMNQNEFNFRFSKYFPASHAIFKVLVIVDKQQKIVGSASIFIETPEFGSGSTKVIGNITDIMFAPSIK